MMNGTTTAIDEMVLSHLYQQTQIKKDESPKTRGSVSKKVKFKEKCSDNFLNFIDLI
jgi:hypothetical protein